MHPSNASPLQAQQPEASAVSRVAGFFKSHARLSTKVGSQGTRDLRWWSLNLSRVLGTPISANQVRLAAGGDARIAVDLAGRTNLKARQTMTAAGWGPETLATHDQTSAGGAK